MYIKINPSLWQNITSMLTEIHHYLISEYKYLSQLYILTFCSSDHALLPYRNNEAVATLLQPCKVVTRLWQFVQGVHSLAE